MCVYIILYTYTHISLVAAKCCKSVFLSLQGRNPFFLEPSVIITITDGNKLTHSSGVPDEVRTNDPAFGLLDSVSKLCCMIMKEVFAHLGHFEYTRIVISIVSLIYIYLLFIAYLINSCVPLFPFILSFTCL